MENAPEIKISKSFKIFLVFFVVIGVSVVGYALIQSGEKIGNIVPLLIGTVGGIFLIYWLATEGLGRINGNKELSSIEQSYLENIGNLKITATVKKYVFSDLDIRRVIRFVVVMGSMYKWTLFWIFAGGTVLVLLHKDTASNKDTAFNTALIISLAIVWCPWLENLILKKIDYKVAFMGKILLTLLLFAIGIYVSP